MRDLFISQNMFQDQGVGDDEHQRDGQASGLKQRVAGVFVEEPGDDGGRFLKHRALAVALVGQWPHVTIDECRHEERIDGRDGGRLCWGEQGLGQTGNAIDPDHDDNNQHQAPERIGKGRPDLAPALKVALGHVLDRRHHIDRDHQHDTSHDAGNDTGQEHAPDGDFDSRCIDDHDNGRRDQDAQRAGVTDHTSGEIFRVSNLLHGGDNDGADGHDGRRGRPGQGGKQHAGKHAGNGQTAA